MKVRLINTTMLAAAGAALLLGRDAVVTAKGAAAPIKSAERLALLRRAQIWTPTNVRAMDIRTGPRDRSFAPGATIPCTFVDKHFGGRTPKFGCEIDHEKDDVLKVRYGRDNGEVYAGVAATRLLWALGFGADALYPVHVVCRKCPEAVAAKGDAGEGGVRFDIAAVEREFKGRAIEAPSAGPGWSWQDLALVDEQEGGATLAQRDALKLLAVFIQHSDNKADQQKFVCRDGKKKHDDLRDCADPFLMIHDVGMTFGRANLFNRATVGSVNLEMWSTTPIWKPNLRCVGNLASSQTGTLTDPSISEAGRKFLADLLAQLSDRQIRDLFTVARFADKPQGGGPVEAWVRAFKQKREEISAVHCN